MLSGKRVTPKQARILINKNECTLPTGDHKNISETSNVLFHF